MDSDPVWTGSHQRYISELSQASFHEEANVENLQLSGRTTDAPAAMEYHVRDSLRVLRSVTRSLHHKSENLGDVLRGSA